MSPDLIVSTVIQFAPLQGGVVPLVPRRLPGSQTKLSNISHVRQKLKLGQFQPSKEVCWKIGIALPGINAQVYDNLIGEGKYFGYLVQNYLLAALNRLQLY